MKLKGLKSIFQFPEQLMAEKKKYSSKSKTPAQVLKHSRMPKPVWQGVPWLRSNRHLTAALGWTAEKWRHFRCHHILCKVWRASCSLQHPFPTLHFTQSTSLCGLNAKWGIQPCLLHRIPFTLVFSTHLQGQDHIQIYLMSELKHDATFSDWFSKQALTKIIFNSN